MRTTLLALLLLLVAACGGDDEEAPAASGGGDASRGGVLVGAGSVELDDEVMGEFVAILEAGAQDDPAALVRALQAQGWDMARWVDVNARVMPLVLVEDAGDRRARLERALAAADAQLEAFEARLATAGPDAQSTLRGQLEAMRASRDALAAQLAALDEAPSGADAEVVARWADRIRAAADGR